MGLKSALNLLACISERREKGRREKREGEMEKKGRKRKMERSGFLRTVSEKKKVNKMYLPGN